MRLQDIDACLQAGIVFVPGFVAQNLGNPPDITGQTQQVFLKGRMS